MTSDDRLSLRALWGDIQRAVSERRTVAETWQIANDVARARGFSGVSGGIEMMNELRGTAAHIRDAALRFARLDPSNMLTSDVLAPDINAASLGSQSVTPVYRVRFLHTIETLTGQLVGTMRTASFPFELPSSKAALLEELALIGQVMAEQYGERSLSVSDIEITVV